MWPRMDSEQNMMANQDKPNRIPVRFVDEEESSMQNKQDLDETNEGGAGGSDELSPEELGRASSYEDATDMQRRIDRGAEGDSPVGRERADETDTAGGAAAGEGARRRG